MTTDWMTGVPSPAGAEGFSSSLCGVQTASRAHPAFCPMGTGGLFPGLMRGNDLKVTTQPHLERRSRTIAEPPSASMASGGKAVTFY
jgi:hypothetical protein